MQTPRNVSLDFIALQLQRLLGELADLKSTASLDRRNTRSFYDNLSAEMTRQLGAIDAKLEMSVEQIQYRLDTLEQHIDQRIDRLEAIITK